MAKPKGKTPSLLSVGTGPPAVHTCGRATPCDRCEGVVRKDVTCFRIPKAAGGFTNHPIFCAVCVAKIIEQTKLELTIVESLVANALIAED